MAASDEAVPGPASSAGPRLSGVTSFGGLGPGHLVAAAAEFGGVVRYMFPIMVGLALLRNPWSASSWSRRRLVIGVQCVDTPAMPDAPECEWCENECGCCSCSGSGAILGTALRYGSGSACRSYCGLWWPTAVQLDPGRDVTMYPWWPELVLDAELGPEQ